jgi:pilus assembly protein TadC
MNTLFIAYAAAFIASALLVLAIARVVGGIFTRNERQWILARRENDSKSAALAAFARQVLIDEGLKLSSVRRMYEKLQKDLVRANYPLSPEEMLGQILLEGVMGFIVLLLLCVFFFGLASLLIPFVAGWTWIMWIRPSLTEADGEQRSRAVYRRLPYALDLGVLVLQSGGTLRDALEIIARNDDPLAEEFRTAITEMDSGASQAIALHNMSNRVGVPALDAIVMAVNRGDETGAPMAQTLSTQAELFREKRLQEIEKLAVEAPTKMTFPNMLVMMSVIVIVLGPVLVKISSSGMMSG